MQLDESQQTDDIKESIIYEESIINIDRVLEKLTYPDSYRRRYNISINDWAELRCVLPTRTVDSNQLWLHNIQYFDFSQSTQILTLYKRYNKNQSNNQQIIINYNEDNQLHLISNSDIYWYNNKGVQYRILKVIDFINYLKPLTNITKSTIITTIIARATSDAQHLFDREIVSIGEFRPIFIDHDKDFRYRKITQESYRNSNFQFFHNHDLFKSCNYCVQERTIITLNHFVKLEIVVVKKHYFEDIIRDYQQNPFIQRIAIQQPHLFDRFDRIDYVTTKYYPQQ